MLKGYIIHLFNFKTSGTLFNLLREKVNDLNVLETGQLKYTHTVVVKQFIS